MSTNQQPNAPAFPIVSFDAIPFLMRQRTRLQRIVSKEYFEMMHKEFVSMVPHLPATANRILDIGGGLGGIDIHLSRHYGNQPEIHMLDRIGIDEETYFGYEEVASKYNDPEETRAYLGKGGVPEDQFYFWDADKSLEGLSDGGMQFDVILSLKSWCFHYPYSTYEDLVSKILAPGGVMFVDVRLDSDQIEEIERTFHVVKKTKIDLTSERLILQRKR